MPKMMYFLQEGPANTTDYMLAGYAIIFGVMLIYLVSLYIRRRNLQQDLQMLEEMENRKNG